MATAFSSEGEMRLMKQFRSFPSIRTFAPSLAARLLQFDSDQSSSGLRISQNVRSDEFRFSLSLRISENPALLESY